MLASPPTLRRYFDVGDELLVFAEVYVNDSRLREGAAATLVVTASDGRDVIRQDAPLVPLADTDASRVALVAHVPLDTLRPDTYTMTVEARSGSAPSSSATRQAGD